MLTSAVAPSALTAVSAMTPQRDMVVTSIRRAIVTGELRPGEKLREVALAADVGVSRPTLREALNGLVQAGLLTHAPYRGYAVASLDAATIRDLAETRVALDLIAVKAICSDRSGRRVARLQTMWQDVSHRMLEDDPLVQHDAHIAFHHGLWDASENQMLVRMWPVTEALMTITLAQDQAMHHDPLRAYRLHRLLVDTIADGNLGDIERVLAEHTVDSAEHIIADAASSPFPGSAS